MCDNSSRLQNMKGKSSMASTKTKIVTSEKNSNDKNRKPYPSYEERIKAVESAIIQANKLIASREALIAATEKKLSERKIAMEYAQNKLIKLEEKKNHIVANQQKAERKAVQPKLSPEERAERRREALAKARAVRKAEKEKRDLLMEKLEKSGKSIDEVLATLG